MKRHGILFVFALALALAPEGAFAKGKTVKIVVDGAALAAPIEMTEPGLEVFGVWEGPGVHADGVDQKEGFIINWRSGARISSSLGLIIINRRSDTLMVILSEGPRSIRSGLAQDSAELALWQCTENVDWGRIQRTSELREATVCGEGHGGELRPQRLERGTKVNRDAAIIPHKADTERGARIR